MVYSAYARYIPYIYSGMVYLRPLCRISHVGYIMWQVKIRIANQNHKLQIFLAAVPRKKKFLKSTKNVIVNVGEIVPCIFHIRKFLLINLFKSLFDGKTLHINILQKVNAKQLPRGEDLPNNCQGVDLQQITKGHIGKIIAKERELQNKCKGHRFEKMPRLAK